MNALLQRKQIGFTLIELIVVIVILGILAATALPRYYAMQTQARIAKLNGTYGAVKGAASLAHGACIASSCTTTLAMEGTNVTIIDQYPTADANGIIIASGWGTDSTTAATALSTDGLSTTGGGAAAGSALTVEVSGGTDAATCSFTYTSPTAAGNAPVYGVPVTTGC